MNMILRGARKIYSILFHPNTSYFIAADECDISGQQASDEIEKLLRSDKPAMIARLGLTETKSMIEGTNQPSLKSYSNLISRKIDHIGWTQESIDSIHEVSGFFPATRENVGKFVQLMLKDMPQVDILGSWMRQEKLFGKELKQAIKVPLGDLEPFFHPDPWSKVLKGKKVLVIHPFEATIKKQYQQREKLFSNPDILPEFELKTIKAVQTIAHTPSPFGSWFEALKYMEGLIDNTNFDIAIIGAGAYGFPLAAHIKSIGKKAIHLGGATQLLFGIKGKRWEDRPEFQALFNEYWVKPLDEDRPENFQKVEDGCYW